MIQTKVFGKTADGREVLAFTLGDGVRSATILNYGGIVQSIVVPDRDGKPTDVILGYNDLAGYENNGGYLGALIGRFGNRIGEGKLTIDGTTYELYCNDRGNHLHGGKVGFNKKIWAHEIDGDELKLSILSPDGEENYPGNLSVTVTYTFKDGELKIAYHAETDKILRLCLDILRQCINSYLPLFTGSKNYIYRATFHHFAFFQHLITYAQIFSSGKSPLAFQHKRMGIFALPKVYRLVYFLRVI